MGRGLWGEAVFYDCKVTNNIRDSIDLNFFSYFCPQKHIIKNHNAGKETTYTNI